MQLSTRQIGRLLAGAAVLVSSTVGAQESASSDLAEIVVTAQKRAERLQDVPVSVGVLTAEQLDISRIQEIADVQNFLPNFRFTPNGSRVEQSAVAIRGLRNYNQNIDVRALVIIDDVPINDFVSLNNALFDTASVELLRGPQSTLYGLNAEAGVLNVRSIQPGERLSVRGSYEIGTSDQHLLTGSVSGPLSDAVRAGVTGFYQRQSGFFRDVLNDRDFDDYESFAVRSQLVVEPSDRVELLFTGTYSEINDRGRSDLVIDKAGFARITGVALRKFQATDGITPVSSNDQFRLSLRGTVDLGSAELVSVTSYREYNGAFAYDGDRSPLPDAALLFFFRTDGARELTNGIDEFYQELRLQSTADAPLQWLVGAAYNKQGREIGAFVRPRPGIMFDFVRSTLDARDVGIFANLTYAALEDRLKLSAGARYAWADREVEFIGNIGVPPGVVSASDDIILPRFIASYNFTDDVLGYISAARGWVPGGINSDATNAAALSYDSEQLWSYEAGLKLQSADRRVTVNAAAFYMDVDDFQTENILNFGTVLNNANRVEIYGFELETSLRLTPAVEITGGVGFKVPKFKDYLFDIPRNIRGDGKLLPQVPKWEYNLAATLRPRDDLFVRAELAGASGFYTDVLNTYRVDGYAVLNLRAGYESERWSVTAFVENVFDKEYFLGGQLSPIGFTDEVAIGTVGAPLNAGVRVAFRF